MNIYDGHFNSPGLLAAMQQQDLRYQLGLLMQASDACGLETSLSSSLCSVMITEYKLLPEIIKQRMITFQPLAVDKEEPVVYDTIINNRYFLMISFNHGFVENLTILVNYLNKFMQENEHPGL